MPYLIDGHNLIGKMPDVSLQDIDDESDLINKLNRYFQYVRKKAIVFFDRGSLLGKSKFGSAFLEVRFIRAPKTADEAIIQKLVDMKGNARNFSVVSSDRWVAGKARQAGARTISSEEFVLILRENSKQAKMNHQDHENDTEYWLKTFRSNS
jgi:predicted RNA-binding protein with PIN domain